MSVTYTCPKCGNLMKPAAPLPAGKKIKCKGCEHIFAVPAPPPAAAAKKAAAKPAAECGVAKKEDEYGKPTAYGVMKDDAEAADKTVMAEKHRAVMGQIKDRFDKSARGPATAILVRPATFLIAEGVIVFFAALGYAFWAIFPLVFETRDNDSSKAGQIVAKKTDDQLREEWN